MGRRLVADAELKTGWAPVDKLHSALGLDVLDRALNIVGDDISTEQQAACHELALPGVTLHHLVTGLEARVSQITDGVLFVGGFSSGDNRSVGGEGEVNTGESRRQINKLWSTTVDMTHGTKFVWNSFKSTLSEPSNRSEAVMDETT